MIKHKSTLAKLLAKENISVQYGNYSTAWFDIKDRILGLPMWKDMGKDVADLLIGHEVGHALFTPFEGWHDSPEKLEGCPRTYINVIEDARIERHIKDAYVGLISPMARGYKKLFDDGFFGKEFHDMDWDNVKLIDKINLKAKVGAHLDVPMNDEEIVYYNRAMTTETFDEVLQLVRDVLAYTKENQEELLTPPPAPEVDESDNQEEKEQEQEQEQTQSSPGHDDVEPEEKKEEEQQPSNSEGSQEAGGAGPGAPDISEPQDEDVSQSDENFRNKESELLDIKEDGTQVLVGNAFSKDTHNKLVIPFDQLSKERDIAISRMPSFASEDVDVAMAEYKDYIKAVKKDVNFAVKEFEMRKAAYRYSRAQTAKTGSIDVNKVWSYKTNEDIFSRVTQLADAKNHGMVMIIDFSGSMCEIMGNVMDQLIHLVMFCKAVNIPFEVYAFSTANRALGDGGLYDDDASDTSSQIDGELYHQRLSMPQLVTSKLKKADFEKAICHMYLRYALCKSRNYTERYVLSPNEDYGSTPLNEALVASHVIIDKFKRTHNVENMNVVVISDGDTNGSRFVKTYNENIKRTDIGDRYSTYRKMYINIMGKSVEMPDSRKGGTEALLNNIKKQFNATTLGFFIADDRYSFKNKIGEAIGDSWMDNYQLKPFNQEYGKKKCVTLSDVLGYSQLYVLKGKQLETDVEEFTPADDASKGQITQAFKKFSKSKKLNKTLLTNFGKAVAE